MDTRENEVGSKNLIIVPMLRKIAFHTLLPPIFFDGSVLCWAVYYVNNLLIKLQKHPIKETFYLCNDDEDDSQCDFWPGSLRVYEY